MIGLRAARSNSEVKANGQHRICGRRRRDYAAHWLYQRCSFYAYRSYVEGAHGVESRLPESGVLVPGSAACLAMPCIYVINPNFGARQYDNKVTMYPVNANGNVPPIQGIKGPRTKMFVSQGVAVDASGKIYVLNTGDYGSVTVYAAGDHGNVPTGPRDRRGQYGNELSVRRRRRRKRENSTSQTTEIRA